MASQSVHHNGKLSKCPDNVSQDDLPNFAILSCDLASHGIFWVKANADIVYINNAACESLGCTQEKLIGTSFWEYDPSFNKEDWPAFWADLKQKKRVDLETQHQKESGAKISVQIKCHFIEQKHDELMFAYVTETSSANEQKLTLEKGRFKLFVDQVPVGIAINRLDNGKFDYINAEVSRITGYNVDELNQMDYWEITPKKYEAQENEQLISLADTGRYGPYQKEYIHKLGHTYPVLLSGIKMTESDGQEYIWSVIQDMSQQKEIESQIQIAKELAESSIFRLKLANDSAGIGVWEWDLVSGALIWDEWMYKLYGVLPEQFSGAYEAWVDRIHPDDMADTKAELEQAVAGIGRYEPEFRVVHPSGKIRIMKASAEIFRDSAGKALKVIGVNYDITDHIEALNSLAIAKNEAEKAVKAKSEFLANMSHEIRTPMNAILGGLQLLQTTHLDDNLRIVLDNSTYSAKTLLTILNDILDFSKIEEKKLTLEEEPFSVIEVLNSVKFDLAVLASNKGIDLITAVDDDFVDGWIGDVVRIKQIILNLASNAVKFTNKGHVKLALSGTNDATNSQVCIKVSDTGIGMTKEFQSIVFERFSQADTSTTRKFGGTGLGMSISVSLLRLMNGNIDLTSTLGKGTEISVTLPLKQTSLDFKVDINKSLVIPQLSGKRILIAEDNEINQMLIQTMLRTTNAELTTVSNGKLAIDAVKNVDFDLILMDIQMPKMDGLQAQQIIQALHKDLPIIALTANVMVEDVESYLHAGFLAHVPKPIHLSELYSVLNRYIT